MMNKYQEALETLVKMAVTGNKNMYDVICTTCNETTIQELINKETPLKPISKEVYRVFNDIRLTNYCPNCSKQIINVWSIKEYNPHYCHCCGQKLDWSKEDE